MYSIEDRFKMSAKSLEALNRIRSNRTAQIQEKVTAQKPDYSRMIFEEYDEPSFVDKVKFDASYYNMMLSRLDQVQMENVQTIIGRMLNTVRQIYEHINIKPKMYGANRLMSLNESEDTIRETSSRVMNDYINRHYYSLTAAERESRYFNALKPIAADMVVNEQVNPDDAVKFATKAVVIESFIERVNFPMTIRDKIEEMMTSDEYRQMFEQDDLIKKWELFKDQASQISKIVAATI